MSADYTIYSRLEREHEVSWPDGVRVVVHDSWRVAMQVGQGRALLRQLAASAGALQSASKRLAEVAERVESEVSDVLAYVETLKPTQPESEDPKGSELR